MDTLDLLRRVRFDKAFMFAYSMREKTHAHRSLSDDVDEPTKQRRLREVIELFNQGAREANQEQVGRVHLLLVDGPSKKSPTEWVGRTDCNRRASCDTAEMRSQTRPRCDLRYGRDAISDTAEMRSAALVATRGVGCGRRVVFARRPVRSALDTSADLGEFFGRRDLAEVDLVPGDYVAVRVTAALSANTLRAEPIARTSITMFTAQSLDQRLSPASPPHPARTLAVPAADSRTRLAASQH